MTQFRAYQYAPAATVAPDHASAARTPSRRTTASATPASTRPARGSSANFDPMASPRASPATAQDPADLGWWSTSATAASTRATIAMSTRAVPACVATVTGTEARSAPTTRPSGPRPTSAPMHHDAARAIANQPRLMKGTRTSVPNGSMSDAWTSSTFAG